MTNVNTNSVANNSVVKENATMENIINIINEQTNYTAEIQTGRDGREGIVMRAEGQVASPIIYTDILTGTDGEKVAQLVKLANESHLDITSAALKWENVKSTLRLCIRPKADDDVVVQNYLDLQLYVRAVVTEGASVVIKNNMLNSSFIDADADELFAIAKANTRNRLMVKSMFDVLFKGKSKSKIASEMGVSKEMLDEMLRADQLEQLVIRNNEYLFAASGLAYPDLLKEIADRFNDDLYIIPSSIHELIVMKKSNIDYDTLVNMILEVNANEVKPAEVLSNHPYVYRREVNIVTCD